MAGWNLTGNTVSAEFDGSDEQERKELSVSQAVEIAAGALDAIPQLSVLGEVTGFRGPNARSGHCYFQIKDDSAAVDCIVWKGAYLKRTFDLRDGMQVSFKGNFNLYKPTGRMSFVARSFSLAGEGLLRQQVAQLAEKLRREGLMDEARKRRIPVFCSRVAVVTSLSGAVIDDVKRTLRRRNPLVELVCVGAKVQGEGAPAELIEGLRRAAAITPAPDCILLVRGGGSFEDLMTFNDETYWRYFPMMIYPVYTYRGLFTILVLTGTAVLLCIALTAHFRTFAPVARTMEQLGASRARRLGLLLLWAGILGLAGVLLGVLWCAAFTLCMRAGLRLEIHPLVQWPQLLFLLAGVLLTAAGYFVFGLEGKKLFPTLRRRTAEDEDLGASPSLCGPIAVSYLRKNGRRMAAVGLLVVMFVAMIFCTQYDQQVRGREILEAPSNLEAAANAGTALYMYGALQIYSKNDLFSRQEMQTLAALPGVADVDAASRSLPLIYPDGASEYYKRLQQRLDEPILDHEMSEVPAIPQNLRVLPSGYAFCVLDAQTLPYFREAYPDIDVERDLALGRAVLFAELLVMEGLETTPVCSDAFHPGDTLRFAYLESDRPFLEIPDHPEEIQYREETLKLSKCVDQHFWLDCGTRQETGSYLTIVITEETAETMKTLKDIVRFHVYLNRDIMPEQQTVVEREFYRIAMAKQGAMIRNSAEEKAYMQQLWSAIGVVYAVLGGVLGLFILVALVGILYGSLLQRQQMFGILRAAGYRKRQMYGCILTELAVYWLGASLICLMATLFGVYSFMANVL